MGPTGARIGSATRVRYQLNRSRRGRAVLKILFVCGRNRRRSPTAEAIFAGIDGIEVSSAGTSPEADSPVSSELVDWADKIFVMDKKQQMQMKARYAERLKDKRLVCLNIPDRYELMQPELQAELRSKVLPLLRVGSGWS